MFIVCQIPTARKNIGFQRFYVISAVLSAFQEVILLPNNEYQIIPHFCLIHVLYLEYGYKFPVFMSMPTNVTVTVYSIVIIILLFF